MAQHTNWMLKRLELFKLYLEHWTNVKACWPSCFGEKRKHERPLEVRRCVWHDCGSVLKAEGIVPI
jgi:hypothetical protein